VWFWVAVTVTFCSVAVRFSAVLPATVVGKVRVMVAVTVSPVATVAGVVSVPLTDPEYVAVVSSAVVRLFEDA
jgi:hypothetical protein